MRPSVLWWDNATDRRDTPQVAGKTQLRSYSATIGSMLACNSLARDLPPGIGREVMLTFIYSALSALAVN